MAQMEFSYRVPWPWAFLSALVIALAALGVSWADPLWTVLGLLLALAWAAYVVRTFQAFWLARTGRVRVDGSGVTIKGRRGRERSLSWQEVSELRVPRRWSGTRTPWLPIEVQGPNHVLEIDGFVRDAEMLVETIVTRAGLDCGGREGPWMVWRRKTS